MGKGCQPSSRKRDFEELCVTRWRDCPTQHTRTLCDYFDWEENVFWPEQLVVQNDPWWILKQHLLHRVGLISSDQNDASFFHISKKKLCGKTLYDLPEFGIGYPPLPTLFDLFSEQEYEMLTRLTHDRVSLNATGMHNLTLAKFKERIKKVNPMRMMDNLLAIGKLYAFSLFADGCANSEFTSDEEVHRTCLRYQMVFTGALAEPGTV